MKKLTLVLVLVLLCVSSGYSFDGMRKGFVLGGGLGFCPSAKFSIDDIPGEADNTGGSANLFLGYSWDEMNMIVYEINGVGYKPTEDSTEYEVSQGFTGATWYHYFGKVGKSFFTTVGLGMYVFSVDEYDADPGGGILLGGGYEFARHWQFAVYVSSGRTSEKNTIFGKLDFEHTHFSIMINGVAF